MERKKSYITSQDVLGTILKSSDLQHSVDENQEVKSQKLSKFIPSFSRKKKPIEDEFIEKTEKATKKSEDDESVYSELQREGSIHASVSTGVSSINNKFPNAREISETYSTILLEMKW